MGSELSEDYYISVIADCQHRLIMGKRGNTPIKNDSWKENLIAFKKAAEHNLECLRQEKKSYKPERK